jgi:hypothetical protein
MNTWEGLPPTHGSLEWTGGTLGGIGDLAVPCRLFLMKKRGYEGFALDQASFDIRYCCPACLSVHVLPRKRRPLIASSPARHVATGLAFPRLVTLSIEPP